MPIRPRGFLLRTDNTDRIRSYIFLSTTLNKIQTLGALRPFTLLYTSCYSEHCLLRLTSTVSISLGDYAHIACTEPRVFAQGLDPVISIRG